MHWKYALHFGTAAAAALLLSANAEASQTAVIEAIDYQRNADAILVHYHLRGGYDAADVRVGKAGKVVRIVLPDAHMRGSKKQWPKPADKFVKGSFAYQLTPTTVRHKLRLASAVDVDDISVRRFGDVIVARIPKSAAGKAVAMAPKDDPEAAAATPTLAVAAKTVMAPIPLTTAALPDSEPDRKAETKSDKGVDAGRERLMRELFAPAGGSTDDLDADPVTAQLKAGATGTTGPDALAELGADLPDVNPVTWLLIMGALGLLLLAVRRKSRFATVQASSDGRTITVLDRKTVSGKTGVALLEAAGRLVLVGTSETGLTPLADLGPSDDDFQSVVARATAPAPLPASAILPETDEAVPAGPPSPIAPVGHTPRPANHATVAPAIAAVDAFRTKVAALRSA